MYIKYTGAAVKALGQAQCPFHFDPKMGQCRHPASIAIERNESTDSRRTNHIGKLHQYSLNEMHCCLIAKASLQPFDQHFICLNVLQNSMERHDQRSTLPMQLKDLILKLFSTIKKP
jgi:hypothetical protein